MNKMTYLDVPEESNFDKIHVGAKALINLIPLAGGSLAEIFNALVEPPIERRKKEWMKEVANILNKIETRQQGIVQTLSTNEEFTSLIISATIIAYKTHLTEKYEKLKCALINSLEPTISYDIKQVYLQFIDNLTIPHIEILKQILISESLIRGLNSYQKIYDKLITQEPSVSNLSYDRIEVTTFRYIILDLQAKGLLYISNELQEIENATYQGSYLLTEDGGSKNSAFLNITKFGKDFLSFIENDEYDLNN